MKQRLIRYDSHTYTVMIDGKGYQAIACGKLWRIYDLDVVMGVCLNLNDAHIIIREYIAKNAPQRPYKQMRIVASFMAWCMLVIGLTLYTSTDSLMILINMSIASVLSYAIDLAIMPLIK